MMGDPIAERDQRRKFYSDMAERSRDFYDAFIKVGFSAEQTMMMLMEWIHLQHDAMMAMLEAEDG